MLVHFLSFMAEDYNQTKDGFIKHVVEHTFSNLHNLYFVCDDSVSTAFVSSTMTNIQIPLVHFSVDTFIESGNELQRPSGCMIVCEDMETIANIFGNGPLISTQLVPILIFYSGIESFDRNPFLRAVNLEGIQLFIVRGFLPGDRSNARVTYLQENRTILSWDNFSSRENIQLPPDWKPNLNYDGQNRSLRVSVFNCPPFIMLDANETKIETGLEYEDIKYIVGDIPIKWYMHKFHAGRNMWVEVLNDVKQGKSDVAGCSQFLKTTLDTAGRNSYPYYQLCTTFLVSKPRLRLDIPYVFIPMQDYVWMTIIICSGIVVATVYGLVNIGHSIKGYHDGEPYRNNDVTLIASDVIRLLTSSGLNHYPTSDQTSLRCIITVWSATCMILATAYSAGFTSILSYPPRNPQITTIQDVAKNKLWIDLRGNAAPAAITESLNRAVQNLVSQIANDTKLADEAAEKGNYARVIKVLPNGFVPGTDDFSDHLKNDLMLLRECIVSYYTTYVFQNDSPYYQLFDRRRSAMMEYGFHIQMYNKLTRTSKYKYMTNFHTIENNHTAVVLTMSEFNGVYYLLFAGYLSSILVFLLEMILFRKQNRRTGVETRDTEIELSRS